MKNIRALFPLYKSEKNLVYLDNSATSLKPQSVIDKMNEYYSDYGVNIHRGLYDLSLRATNEYEKARENVAAFINAKAKEIIFTTNTTDSLNTIALMLIKNLKPSDEVLTTELEHHSSLLPWLNFASKGKCKLNYITLTKDARISLENVKKAITKNTKILAITYVSNVLGYISPLKEIISYAHAHNIIVIVDAAQAIPHIKIDVQDLDCDFLAFSAHKMFGPTGVGVLFGKTEQLLKLDPVKYGGDMNDNVDYYSLEVKKIPHCFEAGTPMIAEAIGLSEACNFINNISYEKILNHEQELLKYTLEELEKLDYIEIYNRNPDIGIINFNFKALHPHDAASFFANKNIALRAGYHCAQLVARFFKHKGSLRASFYIYNTLEDAKHFINTIKETYEYFKTFWEEDNESR